MLPSIANNLLSNAVNNILQEKKDCHSAKVELKREIRRVRQERKRAMATHKKSMKVQCRHLESLQERIKTTRSEELPMHRYASELKDRCDTPTHILLLQAQVCRAVHNLCVDIVQLQMLERLKETLQLLSQGQEGEQLNRVLWAVEAKVELQQQGSSEDDGAESAPAHDSNSQEKSLLVTADVVDGLLGVDKETVIQASVEALEQEELSKVNNEPQSREADNDANKTSSGQHDDLSGALSETTIHSNHFGSEQIRQRLQVSDGNLNGKLKDSGVSNDNLLFNHISTWESPKYKEDEDWQQISVEDLKKSNLDTLLDDSEDKQDPFHTSLPMIRESHVAMNRRGSMLAERCYSDNVDADWC